MFAGKEKSTPPPPTRPRVVIALVVIAVLALALSVSNVLLPARGLLSATWMQPLQVCHLVVSSIALALALSVAWPHFRHRVRQLDGMITVCAWTRRVRWQGRWISFEEYLDRRFNLRCTHGICEEAAERMRQEIARKEEAGELRG